MIGSKRTVMGGGGCCNHGGIGRKCGRWPFDMFDSRTWCRMAVHAMAEGSHCGWSTHDIWWEARGEPLVQLGEREQWHGQGGRVGDATWGRQGEAKRGWEGGVSEGEGTGRGGGRGGASCGRGGWRGRLVCLLLVTTGLWLECGCAQHVVVRQRKLKFVRQCGVVTRWAATDAVLLCNVLWIAITPVCQVRT